MNTKSIRRRGRILRWILPVLVVLAGAAFSTAETVNCTAITTVPYVISASGVYCLTGDLDAGGLHVATAIEIQADDVVLDLNGHALDGLGSGPGTTLFGIYAHQRKNVTIRNGTVRGFLVGIYLDDQTPYTASRGHVIESMRADRNTNIGILAAGEGIVVRKCQVVATGGTTLFVGLAGKGIWMVGSGHRVLDNDIVTGLLPFAGIYALDGSDFLVVGNRLTQLETGILFESNAYGKYRDNLTSGVATPYVGGTDAGNNN